MASQNNQTLKGPALAASLAALIAFFVPGGQAVSVAFFSTFATTYALQAFAMRQARKASLQDVAERSTNIRSAQSAHRVVYGHALVGGTVVYAQSTGAEKELMHLVLTLAGHEIHSVGDVWFEDVRTTRDGTGAVTAGGELAGLAWLTPHLGTLVQTADADLVTASAGKWTSAHTGLGIAYLYAKIKFDQDKLFTLPILRALVRGKQCYDPRTGTTVLTMNPALIVRDFLLADYGMGIDTAEVDATAVSAAADICDEWVALDAALSIAAVPDHTTDTWTASGGFDSRIGTGDRVVLTGVPVPAGLTNGATYYLIRLDGTRYQLASSYQNALEGTPVTFTNNGSGAQTWGSIYQRRYTLNGSFTLDQTPRDIVQDMLDAMAGNLVQIAGTIYIHAGAYVAPTITITADDLRGAVTIRPRKPRHDLVNAIRGSFVDASRLWTQSDYPPVGDSTFVTEDGGLTIERAIDQPFATDSTRAQRLAKIALRRARAGSLSLRCKISALRLQGFDTVAVTIPQLGLSSAVYRIVRLDLAGDDGGLGVDLSLQEESADHYAWSASDAVAPVPTTELDIPSFATPVVAPTSLVLASGNTELLASADGTIISRLSVSWTGAAEPGLTGYEIQTKRATDSVYTSQSSARDAAQTWVAPVEDGASYDVRVRSLAGTRRSAWLTGTHTVVGKTAAPTAPSSLTITGVLGGVDAAWSAGADADYDHSELWEASSNDRATASKVANVGGNRFARSGLPAAVARWYWVRDVDTSGNVSAWYPSSATAGVTATTLSASGGIPTVADASVITASPGNPPPGGDAYWAVFDNATSKIWRWITASGAYSKAADGGDLSAGSVAADRIAVATLSAIQTNTGSLTVDAAGAIASGSTTWAAGNGFWLGDDGGTYKLRIGAAGGLGISWNGTQLAINGGITLSASSDSYVRAGATDYSTGTGYFLGRSGGQYVLRIGNTSTNFMQWDGSALTVKGSIFTGDVQVDTGGNVRGGQTAYNTGTGFFLGYSSGAYKFSIGNPSGNRLTWDGSSLTVVGTINGIGMYVAGTTVTLASAPTERSSISTTYVKRKEVVVPKSGTVRCEWNMKAYAGTTAYSRIYRNGSAVGVEKSTTSVTNVAQTDDVSVSGGDLVQLYVKNSTGVGNGTFISALTLKATVPEISTVLTD